MAVSGGPSNTISAARFSLLVEGWRESGTGSISRRLAQAVRSRIGSGLLRGGVFLPPERSIAAALAVSRTTVVAAFDELRADGLLASRQGRGTWVETEAADDAPPRSAQRLLLGGHRLNLAASVPADASHLPQLVIDSADLASVAPAHGYAPAGLPLLREAIAARHGALGTATSTPQIHVTNGAQHALDLALGALTRRGDVVAVEDPTYVGVFDLLEARGLEALPLPLDLVGAGGTDRLTNLVRAGRARVILLLPAVHSPTGRVRRAADMHRLAHQLDALGLPVIEDNTVADLVFTGSRSPSLASLCERAPVLSVESMSKVAWGGLRLGWLRGNPPVIEQTVLERERTDFGTSVPSQIIGLRLLADYDRLIDERRAALGRASKLFTRLARRQLPYWRAETPAGGLSTWVDIALDAEAFAQHAVRHGVVVAGGTSASRSAAARSHLRVCFDRPALEMEAAVSRLARADEDARGRS